MKKFVWLISALVTCLCTIALWRMQERPANPSPERRQARSSSSLVPAPSFSDAPFTIINEPTELNAICTHDDSLSYRGFVVRRSIDPRTAKAIVTVARDRMVVARTKNERDAVGSSSSCFGLYPVLGTERKQLLVVHTSGGAHCCFRYRIYDFSPNGLRVILDSYKYRTIGDGFDEIKFQDIDGDGVMEFTQRVMTFDYCCDLPYSGSPQPMVVFKYNVRRGVFSPEVRGFSKFLLREVHELRAKAREDPLLNWQYLFAAFTQYVYAGRETIAWRIYHSREGQYLPPKREIRRLLKGDPVYRLISRQRPNHLF